MEQLVCQLAVVLEIIFINLFTTDRCSVRRRPLWAVILTQTLFTAALVALSVWALSRLPFYGNGNGLFVFLGFLYLIPIRFLYSDPPAHSLLIICTAWVYTLIVFSVSVQAGGLFRSLPLERTALVAQTLLFLVTYRLFLLFVRDVFLFILQNADRKTRVYLTSSNLMWFVLIFLIHVSYVFGDSHILRILALAALFCGALLSYILLAQVIRRTRDVRRLRAAVLVDPLTGLGNRAAFFREAARRIAQQRAFGLCFIDLDRFKSINDTYGHPAGDRYLRSFSARAAEILGECGTMYRLAGDEFVCIFGDADPRRAQELADRAAAPAGGEDGPERFLGASTGAAWYPQDGDTLDMLISAADRAMYRMKKQKLMAERDLAWHTQEPSGKAREDEEEPDAPG